MPLASAKQLRDVYFTRQEIDAHAERYEYITFTPDLQQQQQQQQQQQLIQQQ
jgi:hypothetical protein